MDGSLLYILIAAVTALFAFGVTCLIQGLTDGEKRKLAERLGGDDRVDAAATRQSIVIQQMESGGLPPALARNAVLQALHKRVIQAFPELTLSRFLLVAAFAGVFVLLLTWVLADSLFIGAIAGAIAG